MIFRRTPIWLGLLTAAFVARAGAEERNLWPVVVEQTDPAGNIQAWSGLGPFLFSQPAGWGLGPLAGPVRPAPAGPPERHRDEQTVQPGDIVAGFRPFYVQRRTPDGDRAETTVLYPLFFYRSYGDSYLWSIFDLINRYGRKDGAPPQPKVENQTFDVWPFYFSRETGDPATSYHAVFPLGGTIQDFFGNNYVSWVLFPLYVRSEKHGAVTTSTPWPIVRTTTGAEHGFALWPLFGHDDRSGEFSRAFFLWPLGWNNTLQAGPDKPAGTPPTRQVGFLPFYSAEHGPGKVNENYLWPFFGYTDRTAPDHYHEVRYFWPLLVQGRGDKSYVDRWGPFYTHSVRKEVDKTWIVWPLWRRVQMTQDGLDQTKTQLFYFLYWDLEQRRPTNPAAAPARKTHFWPLLSLWDNGAGRRQFQFPSPLEVFFPDNHEMREAWTPLFALARGDRDAAGNRRLSLLWGAVNWESRPAAGRSAFHLGPLFSVEKRPAERRWALGNGLLGWKRGPGDRGWRPFVMEFSPSAAKDSASVR